MRTLHDAIKILEPYRKNYLGGNHCKMLKEDPEESFCDSCPLAIKGSKSFRTYCISNELGSYNVFIPDLINYLRKKIRKNNLEKLLR